MSITPTCKTRIVVTATTVTLIKANTQSRGTSFVVPFVLALNRVNVVTVTTILVLHVGVIGHHVPCHYDFMFPRRSYHARLRARGSGPRQQGGLGSGTPPNDPTVSDLLLKSVKKRKTHFRSTLPLSFKVDRTAPIYFQRRCGIKFSILVKGPTFKFHS